VRRARALEMARSWRWWWLCADGRDGLREEEAEGEGAGPQRDDMAAAQRGGATQRRARPAGAAVRGVCATRPRDARARQWTQGERLAALRPGMVTAAMLVMPPSMRLRSGYGRPWQLDVEMHCVGRGTHQSSTAAALRDLLRDLLLTEQRMQECVAENAPKQLSLA
jgi:hypothetical protein